VVYFGVERTKKKVNRVYELAPKRKKTMKKITSNGRVVKKEKNMGMPLCPCHVLGCAKAGYMSLRYGGPTNQPTNQAGPPSSSSTTQPASQPAGPGLHDASRMGVGRPMLCPFWSSKKGVRVV